MMIFAGDGGMNEQLTEQQAKRYSRQRRDTEFEVSDGSAYRNGVKISAEDRARTRASREKAAGYTAEAEATGRIGTDAAGASSPGSLFRTATNPSLDAYASAQAKTLERQNAIDAQRQDSPEKLAAAATREKEIVARRDASWNRFADTAAAIREGKPLPPGVSVTMGGDPNQTVDDPSGQGISGVFKDGTKYTLTGRTRAERVEDAKRQGIYDRILSENPGVYPESRNAEDERVKQDARRVLAGGSSPGITRTADGGIAINGGEVRAARAAEAFRGEARRSDDFFRRLVVENEESASSRGPSGGRAHNVGAEQNSWPASPPLAPAWTVKGAGQRGIGAAAWLASDPSAANPANFLDTAERYGRATAGAAWDGTWEVPEKGLIRQGVEAALEQDPLVRAAGNIIGAITAEQQRRAAQAAGLRPDDAALRRADAMAKRIRANAVAPVPVTYVGPAPTGEAPPTPGPSPAAMFRAPSVTLPTEPAPSTPAAPPAAIITLPVSAAFRANAAGQGTPIRASLPPAPGMPPIASLAQRRRSPLITAFRAGTANA